MWHDARELRRPGHEIQLQSFYENFTDGQWVAMDAPTGPDGKSSMGVVAKTARIYAVSQKAIARLLKWIASDEGYYMLGFGVKDVNYKLDDKGFITTKDLDSVSAWTSKEDQPLNQLANMVYIFTDVERQARYVPIRPKMVETWTRKPTTLNS